MIGADRNSGLALLFGVLSALGPLAIDLYLPAFPRIAHDLRGSAEGVQLSMASFFIALSMGQTIYGFSYVTTAPFICSGVFHPPPRLFGLLFTATGLIQILGTQMSPRLMRRWGLHTHLVVVTSAGAAFGFALILGVWLHLMPLAAFLALSMGLVGCVGLMIAPASIGVLDALSRPWRARPRRSMPTRASRRRPSS